MTEEKNKNPEEEIKKEGAAPSEKETAESKPKKEEKKSKTAEYEAKLKEKDDKYLRLLAEYDNYKKRTVRERDSIELSAKCGVFECLLPFADTIERAVKTGGDNPEAIKSGMEMALNQFLEALKKEGLEEIPTDIPFDPELHNAVMHVEDETKSEGEITEVFQKGYRLKDKVIRYAMVKVAN